MSDRKNTNKYYPPDYDPTKGSLNTQLGQHPLRKRANKLDEGILVVRFELPYNCWCLTCGCHIGKGVRYNAEKQQCGTYFSTKIWEFRMKCHQCSGKIVIRTDPKNSQYVMYSGIRGKDESFSAADNDTIQLLDSDDKKRLQTDSLFRLEHAETDKSKAAVEQQRLGQLYSLNSRRFDDFGANQALRRLNRTAKKTSAQALAEGRAKGLPFALLPPTPTPPATAMTSSASMIASSSTDTASGTLPPSDMVDESKEMDTFRKRKAIVDYSREKKREKKKLKSTQGMQPHSRPIASSISSMSSIPLTPISLMRTSLPSLTSSSTSVDSTSNHASASSTVNPSTKDLPYVPSSDVLGLAGYGSDED